MERKPAVLNTRPIGRFNEVGDCIEIRFVQDGEFHQISVPVDSIDRVVARLKELQPIALAKLEAIEAARSQDPEGV